MKTKLLKTFLVVMVLATIVSCKKDEATMLPSSEPSLTNNEFVSPAIDQQLRGGIGNLQGVLADLEEEFGLVFDFDDIKTASPSNASQIHIYVMPCKVITDYFLTVILDNNANIIGLYEFWFSESNNADSYYNFGVGDPYTTYTLFSGWIGLNISGTMPNCLVVYPGISIPSDYPYPVFGNVTTGYTTLETYSFSSGVDTPEMNAWKLALRAASTFYLHFYDEN